MKDKMLKKVFSLAAVLAVLAASAVFLHKKSMDKPYVGRLIFAKSYEDFKAVSEVMLNGNTTLYLEDNLWKVKEAQGYYANYLMLNELFKTFNRAAILQEVAVDASEPLSEMMSVKVLDSAGGMIEEATVFEGNTARLDGKYFFVSGDFDFPRKTVSWLQQPLSVFDAQEVETARFLAPDGEYGTDRPQFEKTALLGKLAFLEFDDVVREGDFAAENYPNRTTVALAFSDGLVRVFEFYDNGEEYWVKKSLKTNILPKKTAAEYAKSNSFLYDGWRFRLSADDGKFIISQTKKPTKASE